MMGFNLSDFLLQRLLAGEKVLLLSAICIAVYILISEIERKEALEFLRDGIQLLARGLVGLG